MSRRAEAVLGVLVAVLATVAVEGAAAPSMGQAVADDHICC